MWTHPSLAHAGCSRRDLLALAMFAGIPPLQAHAASAAAPLRQRMATAWRTPGAVSPDSPQGDQVGIVDLDWAAGRISLLAPTPVPSRGHGLLALPDGGFVAVATRPGGWLLRCDAQGQVMRRHAIEADAPARSFDGHVDASADGAWLYTVETDPGSGQGWISVRDPHSLKRVAQCASGGIDPHQLLGAPDGRLLVANGGIPRDPRGRKRDLQDMASCLTRIDPASGRIEDRWTLRDPRLSLRHMAWSVDPEPLLGIALQAEHERPVERAQAPTLALWDGQRLSLPSEDTAGGGYAGDIVAGPGGGFVISAQKQGTVLWWHPAQPQGYTRVAELTEPCALVAWPDTAGVTLNAARGTAMWHLQHAPRMLGWPMALGPDNHAVALHTA